jgi:hypothetical protein
MAIEKGHSCAMYNLGIYYKNVEKNYDLVVKYYIMAIEKGNTHAMNSIGVYYHDIEKKYELAVKYYLKAIMNGSIKTIDYLAGIIKKRIRTFNEEHNEIFVKCYFKFPDKFNTIIQYLQHNKKIEILTLLNKTCECNICVNLEQGVIVSKIDTCYICLQDIQHCILYNNANVCTHVTCIDCHIMLKESNKKLSVL